MIDKIIFAFIIGIALSLITVIADVFIKHASLQPSFLGLKWLILGQPFMQQLHLDGFFL
jgi:hypothetical protein